MQRDVYSEILLKHYRHPVAYGRPPNSNRTAEGRSRICGDEVRLYLRMDRGGRILEAGFEGKGCMISQASASILCSMMKGKTRDEATDLIRRVEDIIEKGEKPDQEASDYRALGQVHKYPARIPCALLAWQTLRKALED